MRKVAEPAKGEISPANSASVTDPCVAHTIMMSGYTYCGHTLKARCLRTSRNSKGRDAIRSWLCN